MPKRPNVLPILARGGSNVFGIMTKGSDNGYLIKDVSVNIKIKLSTYKSDLSRKLGRNDENQQSPNLVVFK